MSNILDTPRIHLIRDMRNRPALLDPADQGEAALNGQTCVPLLCDEEVSCGRWLRTPPVPHGGLLTVQARVHNPPRQNSWVPSCGSDHIQRACRSEFMCLTADMPP